MNNVGYHIQEVHGRVRKSIPLEKETIYEIIQKDILPLLKRIDTYYRNEEACPFGIGNWIIDLILKNNETVYLKLPKEMTKEQFENYIKPLIDDFTGMKKNEL